MITSDSLLEIKKVRLHYPVRSPILRRKVAAVHAVDDVDLTIRPGQTLALVGESGCGKSSLARTILQLENRTAGEILLDGRRVPDQVKLKEFRRAVQVVFQNPYATLDPRMSVGHSIAEPLRAFGLGDRRERRRRVAEVLEQVGLQESDAAQYPHQFSGGQRQRIAIARALAPRPRLIVCDEAVRALDVSVQAQIVTLLRELQDAEGIAYLFVSHDLGIVRQIADDVAVMYLGKIVEQGPVERVFEQARHPYTAALLSAVPIADPNAERKRPRILLSGSLPSATNPPSGCRFRTRCPIAQSICAETIPTIASDAQHGFACHFPLNPKNPFAALAKATERKESAE